MTDKTVADVIAMINRALETPVAGLTAESRLLEIQGLDSLAIERLAAELAEARGTEINPFAFAHVETVGDLARLAGSDLKDAG
ncbi:MAG: acyl carrier protein [Parvibaculaceae bacterium]